MYVLLARYADYNVHYHQLCSFCRFLHLEKGIPSLNLKVIILLEDLIYKKCVRIAFEVLSSSNLPLFVYFSYIIHKKPWVPWSGVTQCLCFTITFGMAHRQFITYNTASEQLRKFSRCVLYRLCENLLRSCISVEELCNRLAIYI